MHGPAAAPSLLLAKAGGAHRQRELINSWVTFLHASGLSVVVLRSLRGVLRAPAGAQEGDAAALRLVEGRVPLAPLATSLSLGYFVHDLRDLSQWRLPTHLLAHHVGAAMACALPMATGRCEPFWATTAHRTRDLPSPCRAVPGALPRVVEFTRVRS